MSVCGMLRFMDKNRTHKGYHNSRYVDVVKNFSEEIVNWSNSGGGEGGTGTLKMNFAKIGSHILNISIKNCTECAQCPPQVRRARFLDIFFIHF